MDQLVFHKLGLVVKSFPTFGTGMLPLTLMGCPFVKDTPAFHNLSTPLPSPHRLPPLHPTQADSIFVDIGACGNVPMGDLWTYRIGCSHIEAGPLRSFFFDLIYGPVICGDRKGSQFKRRRKKKKEVRRAGMVWCGGYVTKLQNQEVPGSRERP